MERDDVNDLWIGQRHFCCGDNDIGQFGLERPNRKYYTFSTLEQKLEYWSKPCNGSEDTIVTQHRNNLNFQFVTMLQWKTPNVIEGWDVRKKQQHLNLSLGSGEMCSSFICD